MSIPRRVAVAGNPNVGKTSLFNALTGERHQVANYPGVTVEVREGRLAPADPRAPVTLLDLPGTYSLTPLSEDEMVASRALVGAERPAQDLVLVANDDTNLSSNLYLVLQLRELGLPLMVALNMTDVAAAAGVEVDVAALARELGVPVWPTNARTGEGVAELAAALRGPLPRPAALRLATAPGTELERALTELAPAAERARAGFLLVAAAAGSLDRSRVTPAERAALAALGPAVGRRAATALIEARYAHIDRWLASRGGRAPAHKGAPAMARSRRIDAVLTHKVWGLLVFVGVMALVFQSIFSWAEPLMDATEAGIAGLGRRLADALGPGLFTDLLTEGVVKGVGNVLVFVPQIALLFLFTGLLQDSGYMARAAFLIDRLMARIGLSGQSFVPLLSGYACAIPAIMGTRTIAGFRDRLTTVLMIPFMSCSARLPVYALVIGALFEAQRPLLGPFTVGGVLLLSMYALSTISALAIGAVYKRTLLAGPPPPLVLELPPYRLPRLRNTLLHVVDRTMDFVRDAGTIILACTVVLWALLSFPRPAPGGLAPGQAPIEVSAGGRAGKAMEPILAPIGQDWRIGIGLVGSFAAREVLVSTLGLVYGIEAADDNDEPLREQLRSAVDPATGDRRYTPLRGLSLMVFFAYACQCMSTLAVVRRETRSWRWPAFMFVSMTAIAYLMAFLTYQGGRWLGLG